MSSFHVQQQWSGANGVIQVSWVWIAYHQNSGTWRLATCLCCKENYALHEPQMRFFANLILSYGASFLTVWCYPCWQEYKEFCLKPRKTTSQKNWNGRAALQQDNAYNSNTQQSRNRWTSSSCRSNWQKATYMHTKSGDRENAEWFWRSTWALEYVHSSFQDKQSWLWELQRQGLSNQIGETENMLGSMVHTAVLTPSR